MFWRTVSGGAHRHDTPCKRLRAARALPLGKTEQNGVVQLLLATNTPGGPGRWTSHYPTFRPFVPHRFPGPASQMTRAVTRNVYVYEVLHTGSREIGHHMLKGKGFEGCDGYEQRRSLFVKGSHPGFAG